MQCIETVTSCILDNREPDVAENAQAAEQPASPPAAEEPPRRVLRPRRGGVAVIGEPAPPVPDPPQAPEENRQDQADAELEEIGQRLRQVAPANLRGNGDADLNEPLDRIDNDQPDLLAVAFPRPDPFPQPRVLRWHRPRQLLADADQIMEELEDFGQMMERIAGNRRAEDDVQQVAPLRPVPAPDRPVDLGAIFDHLRRQVAHDDIDNEVRLQIPLQRPAAAAVGAADQVHRVQGDNEHFPPQPEVPPPVPPGLAQVEPPRRVLRPRRNGAVAIGAPVVNIEQANNVEGNVQDTAFPVQVPPVAGNNRVPLNELGVNVNNEQPENNPDVQEINVVAGQEAVIPRLGGAGPRAFRIRIQPPPPGEVGEADALQRFMINFQDDDDVAGAGVRVPNPVQVNVFPHQPNDAAAAAPRGHVAQPQANDVIINNIDIPPLVRPLPLNQQADNVQPLPPVEARGDGRQVYNNLLRQLMPMLERAQMVNPIPIRRAPVPAPEEPNLDEDMFFHPPLPVRFQPLRVRGGPGLLQVPRQGEREGRPVRHHSTERDELGTQIQQIIASVQQENTAKTQLKTKNDTEESQPSTSSQVETKTGEKISKSVEEKEEEIKELIRRREGQEQALIEAMRNVMQEAGDNGEVKRKAVPIFLRLQAEELKATRKMIDLRERIVNGGETEIAEAEKKVQDVLQELEEYEQNALEELKDVIAKDRSEAEEDEPRPGTSAETAHEAVPPENETRSDLIPDTSGGTVKDASEISEESNEEGNEEKGEHAGQVRARIQAMVRQRQQEGVNLHQALRDAIAQGGNDAEIQERLQPILMRLDTDELTAMHRILEVLHECIAEGLNPEQVEQRLQNIVNRQREDERTALEAMQAAVAQQRNQQTHQQNAVAGMVN